MPGRVAVLVETLRGVSSGLTGPELLAELRKRWPTLSSGQLRALIDQAGLAVVEEQGRFRPAEVMWGTDETPEPRTGPLRAVAFDIEAVPRLITTAPYIERGVWQVGAVRFGRDAIWVEEQKRLTVWVELAEGFEVKASAAEEHGREALPATVAYGQLAAMCAGADVLIAYNGTGLDFGAIDEAFDEASVRRIEGPARVDALYLAYAWWPMAGTHRLRPLAEEVGVDVSDLKWHDGADDAEMLARLVTHGARQVTGTWSDPLADLIEQVGASSAAWRLVFDLAERAAPAPAIDRRLDENAVAQVFEDELIGRTPLRPRYVSTSPVTVPPGWLDASGHVDPFLLSASINPSAEHRETQEQMTAEIRGRFLTGPDLAVEAPTGTGKSLAALAAAIDWLAIAPDHRVVIATHTKQLQAQLATDVEDLAAVAPTLLSHTSLVKGAANRLSMRALVNTCTDLCARPVRGRRRTGVFGEYRFAELVVYLILRLLAMPVSMLSAHEARSVDTADVPPFFADYSSGRWGAYLAVLSQASAGDYDDGVGLGAHTRDVSEHIDAFRLVIANHALVFAHLEHLKRYGDKTLLVVDEAHSVEGAATDAFSSTLSYAQVERASSLLSAWAERSDISDGLRDIATQFEHQLESERPVRTAMTAVDRISGVPASDYGRTATLASPFSGDAGAPSARRLFVELATIAKFCSRASRLLYGWNAANRGHLSRRERDREAELATRLAEVDGAASGLMNDVDLLLGTTYMAAAPPPPAAPAPAPTDANGTGRPSTDGDAEPLPLDDLDGDHGEEADADEPDTDTDEDNLDVDDTAPPGPPLGNRVVWIAEHPGSELGVDMRRYRFDVRSSPIRLVADVSWLDFRTTFARTIFTSATLTVADGWDYLFDRLGITDCDTLTLEGPFDYERQARLVCFSDFPSWAEHTEAAMRSVAHQLAGYATEAAYVDRDPGAMVLTTATATAAGIAKHLAAYTAAAGLDIPLAAAPISGNRRAVDDFRAYGGWLVGSKGLWAGVNVPEPERARIVWINKLPFAPFADPLVAARRADVAARASAAGHPDPDAAATERYYLPLAAIKLRQAAGRLIRGPDHRGVIIVSDRKLGGSATMRRLYRWVLLGSLDRGLLRDDPDTAEPTGGNVVTMADGWRTIWEFFAAHGDIDPARLAHLCSDEALEAQTLLPETRAIRALEMTPAQVAQHQAAGTLEDEVLLRSRLIGGYLRFDDDELPLKPEQNVAIAAVARGDDLLGLLPTGFGKSYCFQLPALALPGVTIVVSPLVSLMHDQALELNKAIGGAVRALVSTLRESSSRAGRQEVAEQLTGAADHRIKLVYVSPERFAHRQFRDWVRAGIAAGRVSRIVFDEAHTLIQWGDDFRPSYRRLATALHDLRVAGEGRLPMSALTATANRSVREGLRTALFGLPAAPDQIQGDPAASQSSRQTLSVPNSPFTRCSCAPVVRTPSPDTSSPSSTRSRASAATPSSTASPSARSTRSGPTSATTSDPPMPCASDASMVGDRRRRRPRCSPISRTPRRRATRASHRSLSWQPQPSVSASTVAMSAVCSSPAHQPTSPRSTSSSGVPVVTRRGRFPASETPPTSASHSPPAAASGRSSSSPVTCRLA